MLKINKIKLLLLLIVLNNVTIKPNIRKDILFLGGALMLFAYKYISFNSKKINVDSIDDANLKFKAEAINQAIVAIPPFLRLTSYYLLDNGLTNKSTYVEMKNYLPR